MDKKTPKHYLDVLEDRKDEREEENIKEVYEGLYIALKDNEEYFLQEAVKSIDFNGENPEWKKITQAIETILKNDPNHYMQDVEAYKKFSPFVWTLGDGISRYVNHLKNTLTGWLSDKELEMIIRSFIAFIQKKDELLHTGKIDPNKTDVDNFLDRVSTMEAFKDKREIVRIFAEKIRGHREKTKKIELKNTLVQGLERRPIQLPSQKDVSENEWKELQEIEKLLQKLVEKWLYKNIITDYFYLMKQEGIYSPGNIYSVVEKLIDMYHIQGKKEDLITDISDYMQRLEKIIPKK